MNCVNPPQAQVICVERGFSIHRGQQVAHVDWSNVVEICAYKVDLFGYDEICIDIRVDGTEHFYWVSEEDKGYREFLVELERRYSGIRPESSWWSEVAFPAFVENRTTLWQRSTSK